MTSFGNIPETLGNLTDLTHLTPLISRSARLKSMMISTGNIPETLGNLTSLQNLDLTGNQLSDTYPDLRALSL
jgi:Leucine-rich repeat (LRR) protein